jgi:hypothetical protein
MDSHIVYFGIDPGVTGAIGTICRGSDWSSYTVDDLPVTTSTYLANQSKSLDIPRFAEILERNIHKNSNSVILATEQMQSMGFKTPPKTLTMLAEMAGSIEATIRMVCRAQDVPLFIRKYQPRVWTHWMFPDCENRSRRKTEAKNESLEKARELFPEMQCRLGLKKHHDRAEALLLAFVALAELQGCVIDHKLKKMGDLAGMYLLHKQSARTKEARFSAIWEADTVRKDLLSDEINSRKSNQL